MYGRVLQVTECDLGAHIVVDTTLIDASKLDAVHTNVKDLRQILYCCETEVVNMYLLRDIR